MARTRSSPRTVAAATRDVDFPHLWRQLRAAGWKAKRSSGLANEWRYTTPDGVRVFVGESAVVEHALRSGLLNETAQDKIARDESEPDASDDGVRLSQIDTDIVLTQGTVNALFGTPIDTEEGAEGGELSQGAVTRAFGLSQSSLQVNETERDAAASLQQLSAPSGPDSEEEEKTEPPATRHRRVKVDVNYVADDENSSDYESFSPGDSDSGVIEDDDHQPVRDRDDFDDDVLSASDALKIDEAFIESLTIGVDDRDKRAMKQRGAALRAMQWRAPSSAFEEGVVAYDGVHGEEAHPVVELRENWNSPLLTFLFFMPKSLWVAITMETNRYAVQQVDRRSQATYAKQRRDRRETVQQIRRRLKSKKGYGTHEILHVVGLLVARMLCPQQRRFAAHWSMEEDGAVPAGNFGRYMARNRCTDILRDLHFVDNEAPRTRDKLWKLRPVVDKLQERFLAGWSLPAVFSYDDGVLPSTSRRNTTRMFMPDKPHRYGSKIFMTCDSRTAYCHRYVVHFCFFYIFSYVVTSDLSRVI